MKRAIYFFTSSHSLINTSAGLCQTQNSENANELPQLWNKKGNWRNRVGFNSVRLWLSLSLHSERKSFDDLKNS